MRKVLPVLLLMLAACGTAHASVTPAVLTVPSTSSSTSTTTVPLEQIPVFVADPVVITQPATPSSTTTVAAPLVGHAAIIAIIHGVFDPYGVGDQAVRIAMCESSLNPRASHIDFDGGVGVGLFQIHPHFWASYFAGGDPYDPLVNTTAALGIWIHNGHTFAGLWACN